MLLIIQNLLQPTLTHLQDNLCNLFGDGLFLKVDVERRETDEPGTAAAVWEQIEKGPVVFQIIYWISAAAEKSNQSDLKYQLNAFVSFRFYI